ncbi:unnamed protein product [Rhizophagus irregularis]|uniref:Uncharacterized protein n=1 Tax=Rhizophagus irregularis TaxID=588596 RepID=A0A915ZNV7_9GLOM|nr:unnamed protein product [Rhizophagus irregularis]CAB5385170.1 unnamed protein product [Rhizophagus irregularis]CAB5395944.1 unnamed protein product [Rhizophagus irregularis]
MNRHTIDQRLLNERTKINDLDERTSRTPRNLNETKRSGRTNKKIEICWEDFEAPECTKIQDIQNFRITTNIFCL